MKAKILLTTLILAGWGLSASAQESVTEQFKSVADTWIRENNGSWKPGSNQLKTVELSGKKIIEDEDKNVIKDNALFVALYGFDFAVPKGMKVQAATLHLVTERYKGNPVTIYGYGNDFTEGDACWNVEASNIADAFATTPAATFTPAGQWGKAIFDKGITEDKHNVEAWTNDVDITSYVKSLPATANRVNLLLTQDHQDQVCFYTREMVEPGDAFQNSDGSFKMQIPAEQLQPYLEVTFVEDTDTNFETLFPVADTIIRTGYTKRDKGGAVDLELNLDDAGGGMFGLIRFELPSDLVDTELYEVTEATLRLVCVQNKGDRMVDVFNYGYDFDENALYNEEEMNYESAIASSPLATFSMNGVGGKAMYDDNSVWADNMKTAEGWTNYIDIKDFIASQANKKAPTVNFLIRKKNSHKESMRIGSKEAVDITNNGNTTNGGVPFTFKAEDLWPQLTITYVKKEQTPAEEVFEIFYGSDPNYQAEGEDKGEFDIWIDTRKKDGDVILYVKAPENSDVFYNYTAKSLTESTSYRLSKRNAPEQNKDHEAELSTVEEGYHEIILPNNAQGTLNLYYVNNGVQSDTKTYSFRSGFNESTSVEAIEATEAAAEYYTLQGVKVANPERGVYIRVSGGKASKIIL